MNKFDLPKSVALAFLLIAMAQFGFSQNSDEWITNSNEYTSHVLEMLAKIQPEGAAKLGLDGYDEEITDLTEGFRKRELELYLEAKEYVRSQIEKEQDKKVSQDLRIILNDIDSEIEGVHLNKRFMLPYHNLSGMIYMGIRALLEDRIPADRRKAALVRLKKYVGSEPGYRPITELAREDTEQEWQQDSLRLAPYIGEVERDLNTGRNYINEIKNLFEQYELDGSKDDYAKLVEQIGNYENFTREFVLPKARSDARLPKEIYAHNLKQFGVDMPIDELQERAKVAFEELQTQMQVLANVIAKEHRFESYDYRDVIRELKKEQLDSAHILAFYQQEIKEIENIIRREHLVTLPDREMTIRLATDAESARSPAPFMSPPRLIGNTGEHGEFVLPLKIIGGDEGSSLKLDDFMHKSASWTLTAHEGRPGHELQFTAIIENGVSQARAIYARNSVNIEGWALYAEELMQTFLPVEGQLFTLWSRAMRAARAFVDPGLNLGLITPESAKYILSHELVLSEALTRSELERYQFRAPGQAISYFNGYARLMALRAETELLLGEKFDQQAFHDFILAQGLLPPALIRNAVLEEFVPKY